MTALTVAWLTLREAARRRVVRALLALTVVLLALSAWGFSKLVGLDTELGTMTSGEARLVASLDRKSTRLNSSHANISYAVFCLKKKQHAPGPNMGRSHAHTPVTR